MGHAHLADKQPKPFTNSDTPTQQGYSKNRNLYEIPEEARPPAWRRYGTVNVKGATIQDKGRHHFMDKVLLFNTA